MIEATIINGKIQINEPNRLQQYVQDCINDAVDRLKNHVLVKDDPLKYVIETMVGHNEAHDPNWQPCARFAKENLADRQTALKFIENYYDEFQETINDMAHNIGKASFYPSIFNQGFDLVKLTVTVYTEIAHIIGIATEIIE